MSIDGKAIAAEVCARAKIRASKLSRLPQVTAIVASETRATRSYLSIKAARAADAGCVLDLKRIPTTADLDTVIDAVRTVDSDALIIQLPLPEAVDPQKACDAIPQEKDADVLGSAARSAFERGEERALLPPVVGAVKEILERAGVSVKGKNTVVIGSGHLVGAPVATWLVREGAQVTVVSQKSGNLALALKDADLIISGAGSPHLIKPEMLKKGVVLIDAGTSESGGALAGDADPLCEPLCSVFTPVPGGVGPIAVAKLFENAVTLAQRATNL